MQYTQFLVFEVGKACNLALDHRACPSAHSGRWANVSTDAVLGDMVITKAVAEAYTMGFAGNIAFHYYNEPMLKWDRIVELMGRIRRIHKEAKFTLWTNGTKLTEKTVGLEYLDQIWISNYAKKDWSWVKERVPNVHIINGHLDGRLQRTVMSGDPTCIRPFNELVIDHHGNGRLCCMDWRGECQMGNVITDGFLSVVQRYRGTRALIAAGSKKVPDICRHCIGRQRDVGNLVRSVGNATAQAQIKASHACCFCPKTSRYSRECYGAAFIGFTPMEAWALIGEG